MSVALSPRRGTGVVRLLTVAGLPGIEGLSGQSVPLGAVDLDQSWHAGAKLLEDIAPRRTIRDCRAAAEAARPSRATRWSRRRPAESTDCCRARQSAHRR